jgi:hypothetical protein
MTKKKKTNQHNQLAIAIVPVRSSCSKHQVLMVLALEVRLYSFRKAGSGFKQQLADPTPEFYSIQLTFDKLGKNQSITKPK